MIAPLYFSLYLAMEKTANRCGYALAVHGSLGRDMDLVAIPWTEQACSVDDLLSSLKRRHGFSHVSNPERKPHGRKVYVLMLAGGAGDGYVDLSVIPIRRG